MVTRMSMKKDESAAKCMSGNFCRCTGYRPILGACSKADVIDIEDLVGKPSATPVSNTESNEKGVVVNGGTGFMPITNASEAETHASTTTATKRHIGHHPLLQTLSLVGDRLTIGGAVTIQSFINKFATSPNKFARRLAEHFALIASENIRNIGTIVGNIILAQKRGFISDIKPVFDLLSAKYEYDGIDAYSDVLRDDDQLLMNVIIDLPAEDAILFIRKIADRSSTSLANLSVVGLWVNKGGHIRLNGTQLKREIVARINTNVELDELLEVEQALYEQLTDSAYRNIALGEMKRFLALINGTEVAPLASEPSSMTASVENGQEDDDLERTLTSSSKRKEGLLHAQGKAKYTADVKYSPNDVHLAFIIAKQVGTVERIEVELGENESMLRNGDLAQYGILNLRKYGKGTKGNVSIDAIVGGMAGDEEELFLFDRPTYVGAPIALILAESRERALQIASLARVTTVAPVDPVYFDIDAAIEANSIHVTTPLVCKGDVDNVATDVDNVITLTGSTRSNPQTHWYLEPLCGVAEYIDGRLEMELTTQYQSHIHEQVAFILGLTGSNVKITTRRIGGGFGGKGRPSDIVAIAAAIGAKVSGRRAIMEVPLRHSHQINGGRPEARGDWVAKFNQTTKKLLSLKVDLYMDVGHTANDGKIYDFCINTLRACAQGPYAIEHGVQWNTHLVKTNKPAAVAMRAPGEMIPLYILESIMDRGAIALDTTSAALRAANLLNTTDLDSVGTIASDRTVATFERVKKETSYGELEAEIDTFNRANKWKKKGLGIVPVRVRWENTFVYGSVSLVVNRLDGSVVVTQFAIEMGAGTHTRVAQTVATTLNLPLDMVTVAPTNTDAAANNTETGGSFTSPTAIRVAQKASVALLARFEPVKKATWLETVRAAVGAGLPTEITLQEANFDNGDKSGVHYYYGAAVSVVEMDVISGETKIRRHHSVFDIGAPVNRALTLGQLEGGLIMGLGHYRSEMFEWNGETGHNSKLVGDYKIPSALDLPEQWHITMTGDKTDLSETAPHIRARWPGECGQHLAMATVVATQDAARKAQMDLGVSLEPVELPVNPANCARALNISSSDVFRKW